MTLWFQLTSRQQAAVLWCLALAVAAVMVAVRSLKWRTSLFALSRAALHPRIVERVSVAWLLAAIACWAGSLINLWVPDLLADTILWTFVAPATMIWTAVKDPARPHLIRRLLTHGIGWGLALEFLVNLDPLPLPVELLVLPLAVLLGLLASREILHIAPEASQVQRAADFIFRTFALCLAVASLWHLWSDRESFAWDLAARQLLLVVWLPLVVAPWAYLVGAFSRYELFFIRLEWMRRPLLSVTLNSRIRLMRRLGISRRTLAALDGTAAYEAAHAGTLPEITAKIEARATNVQ